MARSAFGALQPGFQSQELRRVPRPACGKLFEGECALVTAERGQAPRPDAIDPVASVMSEVGECARVDGSWAGKALKTTATGEQVPRSPVQSQRQARQLDGTEDRALPGNRVAAEEEVSADCNNDAAGSAHLVTPCSMG